MNTQICNGSQMFYLSHNFDNWDEKSKPEIVLSVKPKVLFQLKAQ